MNSQITDKDIEVLCATNPLASEQLRRIMAERQRAEVIEELEELKKPHSAKDSSNGVAQETVFVER